MNVYELLSFSNWFLSYSTAIQQGYQSLSQSLQHNATQAQKVPVTEVLEALRKTLSSMPLEQLTNEQLALLKSFGIDHLIGNEGARYVRRVVVRTNFDPATASSEISSALGSINNTISVVEQVRNALRNVSAFSKQEESIPGHITVRVQFKDGASISDIAEWKRWANDWNDIVRGIGMCVGESPNDTQVIGATNGSIILVLAGTATFVGLLALITKHLANVAKEGLVISNAIEDLRHKRILNRLVEDNLREQANQIKENGVKLIVDEAKKSLPEKINGEKEAALTKAVQKYLRFNELGGDVDFVSPAETEDPDDLVLDGAEIAHIRETIAQVRQIREDIKLLTDQSQSEVGESGDDSD